MLEVEIVASFSFCGGCRHSFPLDPADRRYTKSHEWVKVDGGRAIVGITEHAQNALGDIVFVELPGTKRDLLFLLAAFLFFLFSRGRCRHQSWRASGQGGGPCRSLDRLPQTHFDAPRTGGGKGHNSSEFREWLPSEDARYAK